MNKSIVIASIVAGALSALSFVLGRKIGQIQQYDMANVGRCERCIRHLKCRTAVSWATHLIEDHGCTEDDAYTTIDRLYMRMHGGE
jgi:hypothetical protein